MEDRHNSGQPFPPLPSDEDEKPPFYYPKLTLLLIHPYPTLTPNDTDKHHLLT